MLKHIFARITDDMAFCMDMMAYVLCCTKMPAEVPHRTAVSLKETLSSDGSTEIFLHLNKFSFLPYFNFILFKV